MRDDETQAESSEPPLTRVCRKCSTQSTGTHPFCPNCGTRFDRRRRLGPRGKRILAATLGLLLVGGVTAGVLVKRSNDESARQERLAEQRAIEAREAEEARERRAAEARRARERAEHRLKVALRRALVRDLRRSVTEDAKRAVASGLLAGPILRTECTPVGGGNIDDTAQHTGRFECMAVTTIEDDGTMYGYPYAATVNYEDGTYSWRLDA